MYSTHRAITTALTALGSTLGHPGGDFLVQSDCDARRKQLRTRSGRIALARHATTYALAQAATKTALYAVAGHRVHPVAQLAGAVTEAALHAAIDDGRLLARFAQVTGKWGFHQAGTKRQVIGVIDDSDGTTEAVRRVHLVDADEYGDPLVERDADGRITAEHPHDNANPSTGRALMDQAAHEWLQIPAGVAVTVLVDTALKSRR